MSPFTISKRMTPRHRSSSGRGFTLVEVLVVLAIISIIMFLSVPNMGEIIKGSKLTQAGDQLRNDLAQAQMAAIKQNLTVEVRFYQYKQPEMDAAVAASSYSAYQMFTLIPDSTKPSDPKAERILAPFGRIKKLPSGIVIPSSETWSTLVSNNTIATGEQQVLGLIPTEKQTAATYRSFQLNPDGTTNLGTTGATQWYVTLVNLSDLERAGGAVESIAPNNYICIQLDPYNGGTRWFQPN
ncbi:MAG: Verru_Chthon cassette protein D [Verrucomicrobiaceae bacterium]|nr:MAG: Verru_Chthon cassette protein D [Verrucomicrobiaceae bacterium]